MNLRYVQFLFLSTFLLTSCSWINQTTDRLIGRERLPVKKEYVSKAQYDELLRKYEALKGQKDSKEIGNTVVQNKNINSELLNDLNDLKSNNSPKNLKTTSGKQVIETVDVFGADGLVKSSPQKSKVNIDQIKEVTPAKNLSFDETNQEVGKYRQGALYMGQGKNDLALRVFQELERSPLLQVRVRAIYKIGELLLTQGEFDLAMQVFENIIDNYAFSGVVLESLKNLVTCSEKLNLIEKRDRYHSMLKDIFGV